MFQSRLSRVPFTIALVLALAAMLPPAQAQVSTTGIRGVVRDPSGASIPTASVSLKDQATGIEKTAETSAEGAFTFVNLQTGTYELKVSAAGFQTSVLASILADTGRITDVSVEMKVGSSTDSVEVAARSVELSTTSNEVGTTINNRAIEKLPYTSRDALNFALLMPGAQSGTGGSTFNGLPNASMNITLDGMNNNSQRFKSGGTSFYEFAPARLDAIEEVTVSTTGLGAEASGQGAMQIRFTTRRGTDKYKFHLLYQFANEDLNANTYFNDLKGLPRSKTRMANYAGSMGGPLLPWIPRFKHKLFFFVNFEELPQPGSTTASSTVLTPDARNGIFTYLGTDGANHTVNLLQIAAANGYPSTIDPTIGGILNTIATAETKGVGYNPVAGIPYERAFLWNQASNTTTLYPTASLNYEITPRIAWHGTWNMRHQNIEGVPQYPGSIPAGGYKITTYVASNAIDWTISPNLLNHAMFGVQSNLEYFYNPTDVHDWAPYGDRNFAFSIFNPVIPNQTPWDRNNPVYQFNDTLTWIKGKHTMTFGGTGLYTTMHELEYGNAGIMNISFGVSASDPVGSVIQAALPNVQTSNTTDSNNAKYIYALLTGRILTLGTSVNVDEKTHQFQKYAPLVQRFDFATVGVFAQDSFRVTPHLTLNYGMRFEFDGAIHNSNGIDSLAPGLWGPSNGPFQPGTLNGNVNPAFNLAAYAYKRDFLNPAPNFGFAWNPSVDSGILGKIVGRNKTVIAGSYGIKFYNEGLNDIANVQSSFCDCSADTLNSREATTQTFSSTAGNQWQPGSLNLSSPLPPFAVNPASFTFPLAISPYTLNGGANWNYINPNLRSPYVQDWNFRIQRELSQGTVLDIRYVGNKATHVWHYQNMNEVNVFESGFLPQFIQAQKNLAISVANGQGNNFSNAGLPGQAPIPIFEAAFGANGSNPALSPNQGFASSAFITNLQQGAAGALANSLAASSSPTYFCRLTGSNFAPCAALGYTKNTGFPVNLLRSNPFANMVNYQDSNANSNYNGLQIELRKAFSHGLALDASYTWSHTLSTINNTSNETSTFQWSTLRNGHLDYGPTNFDHRHSFINYWTYDLPFGRGKRLSVNNAVLDRVVSGWTLGNTNTITSGAPVVLLGGRQTFNNFADDGVILANGLTLDNLVQRVNTPTSSYIASCTCFKSNVADIAQANGTVNPQYLAPSSTPGVIGPKLIYRAKTVYALNLSLSKTIRLNERAKLTFWGQASNFLNHPFLALGSLSTTANTFGNITSATGNRTVLIRAYVDF